VIRVTDERRRWLILTVVTVCHLYPFPYFEALNNPNENVRLYMTMALVEDGTFAIDEPSRRFGWVNDRSRRDGHLYAGKAPGASLIGVPVLAVASWLSDAPLDRAAAIRLLRLCAVTLPCLIFLFVLRRFMDELPGAPWLRDTVFLAYGLGSMAYAYGLVFAGHQLAAVALGGAFISFFRIGQRIEDDARVPWWRPVGAGLLLGAAPAMEYPATIGAVVVGLYGLLVIRRRPVLLAPVIAAAAVPVALVGWFHAAAFGSPFAFPYDFIENPAFQRLLSEGWHGATFPRIDRLGAILISPSFGIFFFTPLLLLAPVGWWALARGWSDHPPSRRHLAWLLPAVPTVLVLYLASSALWRAGWAVGPRYIASAIPFLALSALVGAATAAERAPFAASVTAAVLTLLALLHGGTSGALYPHQPEPFDNPVYDLNMRLIELGFAPHHALEGTLGLSGHLALLPLGLAAAIGAVFVALGPPRPRLRIAAVHAALVLAVTALGALALSRYGDDSDAERRMWALVVRTWEPRGHGAPEREGDPGGTPFLEKGGSPRPPSPKTFKRF
jgi:hypothetical protein